MATRKDFAKIAARLGHSLADLGATEKQARRTARDMGSVLSCLNRNFSMEKFEGAVALWWAYSGGGSVPERAIEGAA